MKYLRYLIFAVFINLNILSVAVADTAIKAIDFINKASSANNFEIQSSRLAIDKSKNAEVRIFANQMIADHTKAGNDMSAVVSSVPSADFLEPRQKAVLESLISKAGISFDRSYISAQVQAHNEAVALFSNYAENGDDEDLKNFANETLPTLQQHKIHIDGLKKSYKP